MAVKPKDIDITPFLKTIPNRGGDESAKQSGVAPTARQSQVPPSTARGWTSGQVADVVLTTLRTGGPTSIKALLQPGMPFGTMLDSLKQLQSLGYVEQLDGDVFKLTDSGHEAVASN
ncbi:MAG TPA: hypothetical protein VII56_20795 [Rhizomicrobium sp.]